MAIRRRLSIGLICEADSLFVAQRFQVLNRDLLSVSNAPIASLRKVMEIVSLITTPAYTGVVGLRS
jgi:hypothetical protein